ncbi:Phage protein [Escherichia coli]|uniref:hypothetical protein n=1 Tax=Escherichia sp. E4694 TaxID=2044464 RepID=UPI001081B5C9|nr:hypothetical protein [Escherichia sp. E4694]TGB74143.1 hypothetical protein CRI66_21370 [Escherichia sp. E4694]HCP4261228.1 hypothetical protein [Escherichia coli]
MTALVLTAEQIKSLAEFAEQEGQPFYTIARSTIPEFESESGEIVPAYEGLIAYSESEEHGVLQLDD